MVICRNVLSCTLQHICMSSHSVFMTTPSYCRPEKTFDTLGVKVSEVLQLGDDHTPSDEARQCDSVLKDPVIMPPGHYSIVFSSLSAFSSVLLSQTLGSFESKEGVAKERKSTEYMLRTR